MLNNCWRLRPKPASFCRGRFQIETAADEHGKNVGPTNGPDRHRPTASFSRPDMHRHCAAR